MKVFKHWKLALRLLARDWRAGEQRILVAALIIAVAASTAIGFFTDRLGRGMVNQSADFLGADLALVSPRPIDSAWLTRAGDLGLRITETLEFASVVVSGDALQLSSVKAVDDSFPLRGSLRSAPAPFAADTPTSDTPQAGEAWAATRLMNRLGLKVGDPVEVGAHSLTITRILTFEPGQAGNVFGVSPRLLMNRADLPATQVIQPGSRLSYQTLFAGPEAAIARYRAWLKSRLDPSHRLVGVREGRRAVGTALERAERFLGLSILAAIVLAGVAIAMGSASIAGEERDGTIGLLLANPKSRTEVLLAKAAALVTLSVLAVALLWAGGLIVPAALGVDTAGQNLAALMLHMLAATLFFGFLALAVGAWTGNMSAVTDAILDSSRSAVDLSIKLIGVMAFFLGLSKVARLVDMYARRLQIQESLTMQIAEEFLPQLQPLHPAAGKAADADDAVGAPEDVERLDELRFRLLVLQALLQVAGVFQVPRNQDPVLLLHQVRGILRLFHGKGFFFVLRHGSVLGWIAVRHLPFIGRREGGTCR